MFSKNRVFESSEGNVWKYIFENEESVAEAVLYKYDSFYTRTVICCSTMSGCPVGCTFCGTGKKFIKNLTAAEIVQQILTIVKDKNIEDIDYKGQRFQIMFMSMGEPMLNWDEVEIAIRELHRLFPHAELLLSTVGINRPDVFNRIIQISQEISKVGLQFSIHQAFEEKRNNLIPYKNKLTLREIRDVGIVWATQTRRPVYLNYCIDGNNTSEIEIDRLKDLFTPVHFNLTFSVVCSSDETMKAAGFKNIDYISNVTDSFGKAGYNVRVFDPAGQDDIGGGCGQLWYVQRWMKNHNK